MENPDFTLFIMSISKKAFSFSVRKITRLSTEYCHANNSSEVNIGLAGAQIVSGTSGKELNAELIRAEIPFLEHRAISENFSSVIGEYIKRRIMYELVRKGC